MCKSILFNRTIASVFFLFFLIMGCEEAAQPPAKPTVVKKKIAEKSPPAEPEKAEKPAVLQPKPTTGQVKVDSAKPQKEGIAQELVSKVEAAPQNKGETMVAGTTSAEIKTAETPLTEKIEDTGPRYIAEGKIDPFAPIFKDTPEVSTEPKEKKEPPNRPLTPLEKIDISQLKLVAIIRAASGNRAMVEDATGKGYIIINGSYVGKKGGRVVQIDKDRAFIEEEAEDIFGKNTVSRRELKLQKPPGEE